MSASGTGMPAVRRVDLHGAGVYTMRMARVNVYLPDELAREARAAGLNISKVTQEALSGTLAHSETDRWLERLDRLPRANVSHASAIDALDEAREELGDSVRA
jgi:post-segregation antitoxin (ccd killing protein)